MDPTPRGSLHSGTSPGWVWRKSLPTESPTAACCPAVLSSSPSGFQLVDFLVPWLLKEAVFPAKIIPQEGVRCSMHSALTFVRFTFWKGSLSHDSEAACS